jgi:hypothetical protein
MAVSCSKRDVVILFIFTILLQLVAGVVAGLQEDWMRMSLYLFGSALVTFFATNILLAIRLKTYFEQLKDRLPINCAESPNVEGLATRILPVLTAILVPFWLSLSIMAILRQNGFWLALCLFACAVTIIVGTGVPIILKITVRLKQLGVAGGAGSSI